eukprot:5794174-Pleurochrysis_carterae.AAC.1
MVRVYVQRYRVQSIRPREIGCGVGTRLIRAGSAHERRARQCLQRRVLHRWVLCESEERGVRFGR